MKTAIYVENGVTQLVLTPDNDWEKSILNKLKEVSEDSTVVIRQGHFFMNQANYYRYDIGLSESLIFVINKTSEIK